MTPELWNIWWGKVRTSLPKRVANILSVQDWRDAGLIMETEIVRAAVEAERERIAKTHLTTANNLEDLAKKTGHDAVTFCPEANWHRQQAAAIRA